MTRDVETKDEATKGPSVKFVCDACSTLDPRGFINEKREGRAKRGRKWIATFIEEVLASRVFNVTIGNFSTITCVGCGKPIRKRLPDGQKELEAECFECVASYTIAVEGGDKVNWKPHRHEVKCANPKCDEMILLWRREVEVGQWWECKACQARNVFVLGVRCMDGPEQGA